jgi:hypothetical protein
VQLVHLFAGEALVACAFAAALSEPGSGDASRRRSILPRSKLADNARWLRRLMHAEFDPLIGAAETDPLWEEQLTAYLDRLVRGGTCSSCGMQDGGSIMPPSSSSCSMHSSGFLRQASICGLCDTFHSLLSEGYVVCQSTSLSF